MKREAKEKARELRRAGHSVKEICRLLGVAKSSVSVWVRDIPLTEEQKAELKRRHRFYTAQVNGGHTNAAKYRELRRQYQEEGRAKAREQEPLHIAGCMLYWGEGAKARNVLRLSNSDCDLIEFFVRFLRESLLIEDTAIAIRIYCYLGNGFTKEEIEQYWLNALNLPRESLRKTVINAQPRSSQQKGRKLAYGVCIVDIYNTRIVQHVLGAIQEYTGIEKPEWLL
jgi:hypothetical protein